MTHSPEYRRILHRMGYYRYQNDLIFRYVNQEGGWDEHTRNCRAYILKVIDKLMPRKVTILGSGWLLDIPLAEIADRVGEVILVDIVHPPEVKEQVSACKNICLQETDITGGLIDEVWRKTSRYFLLRRLTSLSCIEIPDFMPVEDPGLVISMNVLTQLENLPVEFIRKRSQIHEHELDLLRSCIQRKHMDFLVRNKSILISDVAEIFMGNKGETKVVPTLRTEIPEGKMKEEWTWNFDLRGSDYYNSRSTMKVVAVTFGS